VLAVWVARLGSMVIAASVVVACGGTDSETQVRGKTLERDATSDPTTSTSSPTRPTAGSPTTVHLVPPATEQRDAPASVHDWEGQRFDFGTIHSVRESGGQHLITFDRMQVIEEDGALHSGPTLSEEPIIVANTDAPFVNQSRVVRTFTIADDATIKRLSPDWNCGPDGPAAPTWDEITFADLVAAGVGADTQDSLTFDSQGQVVQVRLSRGC
jgi:hypothetical protein